MIKHPFLFCFLTILIGGLALAGSVAKPADQILHEYYVIHHSLASDSTAGVADAAQNIVKISLQAAKAEPKTQTQLAALSRSAAILKMSDLKTARDQFGELTKSLTAYLQVAGAEKQPHQFYCSMANKRWLQADKKTMNPYYGTAMLKCGELEQ